ncbi:TPA: hypothetical protein ACWSNM_005388, partial [Escherichia coli]
MDSENSLLEEPEAQYIALISLTSRAWTNVFVESLHELKTSSTTRNFLAQPLTFSMLISSPEISGMVKASVP